MNKKIKGLVILMVIVIVAIGIKSIKKTAGMKSDSQVEVSENSDQVMEEDSKQNNTEVKQYISESEKLIQKDNYDGALDILIYASEKYSDKEIDEKIIEVRNQKQKYISEQIDDLEEQADVAYSSGDYIAALAYYDQMYDIEPNDIYLIKRKGVEEAISSEAIVAAETKLKDGDFSEAEMILIDAKKNLSDSSTIEDELKKLENYKPVDLTTLTVFDEDVIDGGGSEMDPFAKGSGISIVNGYQINTGEYIDSGFRFTGSKGTISFVVNGEYNRLNANYALGIDDKNTNCQSKVSILADGKVVFTSDEITGGSLPENIDADISGAQVISIQFESSYEGNLFYVYYIESVIYNIMLSKTI